MGEIIVRKALTEQDREAAFAVRREVFVVEQQRSRDMEATGNDEASHFIAILEGQPAGAARYRRTENGYKLERFAVLKQFRGKGVGDALVKAVLDDIGERNTVIYLHAQPEAINLYGRNGFVMEGNSFVEAGTIHYKMVLRQ